MPYKYRVGDTLAISTIGGDSLITLTDEGTFHRDGRQDAGTGTVIARKVHKEEGPDEPTLLLYQMSVIDGRFDVHRNPLGQLWVNEFELSPLQE